MALWKTLALAALFAHTAYPFPSEGIEARAAQETGLKKHAQDCVDGITTKEACLNSDKLERCLLGKGVTGAFNPGWKGDTCYASIQVAGRKPFLTLLPPTEETKKHAQACVDDLTTKEACVYSDELGKCLLSKGVHGASHPGWQSDTCYASVFVTGHKPFLTLLPALYPAEDAA